MYFLRVVSVCTGMVGLPYINSLLQKYKHEKGDTQGNIITFLKQLAIKPDQMTMVPQQIHDLNQGGLVIMNLCMLSSLEY